MESNSAGKFNMDYIKVLLIKKKKREKLTAKRREENESKELVECSFRPKVNSEYPTEQPRDNRFETLYKVGTKHLQVRKDKPKEEYEIEANGKECTHKPNITKESFDYSQSTVSFDDESHHSYFDRTKTGRLQKKLKEIIHSREPLRTLEELEKEEIESRNEEKKLKEKSKEKKPTSPERPMSNEKPSRAQKEKKTAENSDASINLKASNRGESEDKDIEEKKEQIPLLIIDVNLRPGEKKKIYVFDGDTAEGLAEKFSKEHNLDVDTRNRLKALIQSHMSKLLIRIDEENHSINSENSSSNIFQ